MSIERVIRTLNNWEACMCTLNLHGMKDKYGPSNFWDCDRLIPISNRSLPQGRWIGQLYVLVHLTLPSSTRHVGFSDKIRRFPRSSKYLQIYHYGSITDCTEVCQERIWCTRHISTWNIWKKVIAIGRIRHQKVVKDELRVWLSRCTKMLQNLPRVCIGPVMDNTAQEEYRRVFDWLRFKEIVLCVEGWVSVILLFHEY